MGWPVTKCAVTKIVAKIVKSRYLHIGTGVAAVASTAKYYHDKDKDVISIKEFEVGEGEC